METCRDPADCGKKFVILQPGKVLKKRRFGLFVWEKKIIFQSWFFTMHLYNSLFKIDNFTFNVLIIIVPLFDLDMPFGNVWVWKKTGKVWNKSDNSFSKLCRKPERAVFSMFRKSWWKNFVCWTFYDRNLSSNLGNAILLNYADLCAKRIENDHLRNNNYFFNL